MRRLLKVEGVARDEAFKIERESLYNSHKDHAKNTDDFHLLGKEKWQKIKELKTSIMDLEVSLRLKDEASWEKER